MVASPENHLLDLPWHHFICNVEVDMSYFEVLSAFTGIARHDYSPSLEAMDDAS
jgi:hypothetical protein